MAATFSPISISQRPLPLVRVAGIQRCDALIQGIVTKESEMRRASWRIFDAHGLKLVQDIETKVNITFSCNDVRLFLHCPLEL